MSKSEGRTALYRLHDVEGVLLYVGVSGDPDARFRQHAGDKAWWPEVARCNVEWYSSRAAAEVAEVAAIKAKSPKYNVQHCLCPPEIMTVKLHQALVRGLDLLHMQVVQQFDSHGPVLGGMELPDLSREGLLVHLLERELSARGLLGDAPCWHDGFVNWPDGVIVEAEMCNCGDVVLPNGDILCRNCASQDQEAS